MKKNLRSKKGLLCLLASVSMLSFPALVFAHNSDINFVIGGWLQITVILLFIFVVPVLLNRKYFRTSLKSKKLFLITVIPLILVHLIFSMSYISGVTGEMRKVEEDKMLHPNCGVSLPQSDSEHWGSSSRPCYILDLRESLLSSIDVAFNFLFLYYLLIIAYGVYYLKKVDKNVGVGILKFCSSVIIMVAVAYIFIIIISTPTPGI